MSRVSLCSQKLCAMGRAALWAVALAAVLLTTQPSLAYAQGATRTRVCFNPVEIATG
jgi:hypothetical protein